MGVMRGQRQQVGGGQGESSRPEAMGERNREIGVLSWERRGTESLEGCWTEKRSRGGGRRRRHSQRAEPGRGPMVGSRAGQDAALFC